ncbi:emp24/gp25L/p24 family/GOLD family protein [Perilla frutescens var. frutescens]|nr:emp24/gp25L/p24 family/GOLD family protein [Perilla frutescens var. frutescens]
MPRHPNAALCDVSPIVFSHVITIHRSNTYKADANSDRVDSVVNKAKTRNKTALFSFGEWKVEIMRRMREAAALLGLLVLSVVGRTAALSLTVTDVECVYEYVFYKDDTVSGNFVVADYDATWNSGHRGIDFTVTSPEGNAVHSLKGTFGDKFEFKVPTIGMHKFCFHNPHSSVPESVSFNIHIGHIPKQHDLAKDEHFDPINAKIAELREALATVTLHQRYMRARDTRHRRMNESTRNRVICYTAAEYLLLALTSGLQALYIRRLFNNSFKFDRL